MVTELRDYGDKHTVVVFTSSNKMARRLREMPSCFRSVAYEQAQKGKVALVGFDFYFPRSKKKFLENLGCQEKE